MTQPSKGTSKLADTTGKPQIGDRGASITALAFAYATDDPDPTLDSTINFADGDAALVVAEVMIAFEECVGKINEIISVLETHGLIADN